MTLPTARKADLQVHGLSDKGPVTLNGRQGHEESKDPSATIDGNLVGPSMDLISTNLCNYQIDIYRSLNVLQQLCNSIPGMKYIAKWLSMCIQLTAIPS